MPRVLPFAAADLAVLERRPYTDLELAAQGAEPLALGKAYEAAGPAFTFWQGEGEDMRPLLCGGALVMHPGHATVWAALSRDANRHAIWITKRVRAFVASLNHRRLDAYVAADNPGALDWSHLCGFKEEARLTAFYPDGSDCAVMVKLRED